MILAGERHPNVLGDFGIYPGLKLENASQSFSSFNPFLASSPFWADKIVVKGNFNLVFSSDDFNECSTDFKECWDQLEFHSSKAYNSNVLMNSCRKGLARRVE